MLVGVGGTGVAVGGVGVNVAVGVGGMGMAVGGTGVEVAAMVGGGDVAVAGIGVGAAVGVLHALKNNTIGVRPILNRNLQRLIGFSPICLGRLFTTRVLRRTAHFLRVVILATGSRIHAVQLVCILMCYPQRLPIPCHSSVAKQRGLRKGGRQLYLADGLHCLI